MLDRDKYLSEQEVKQLMDYSKAMALLALERGTAFYVRAWAVIDFLLGTGCRATETRLLKIGNLNLKGSEPTVTVIGNHFYIDTCCDIGVGWSSAEGTRACSKC